MSDLSGRVYEALKRQFGILASRHDADELIAELGLRIERGERSKPDGIMWAKDNRYTVHRWVTEWKADE